MLGKTKPGMRVVSVCMVLPSRYAHERHKVKMPDQHDAVDFPVDFGIVFMLPS